MHVKKKSFIFLLEGVIPCKASNPQTVPYWQPTASVSYFDTITESDPTWN